MSCNHCTAEKMTGMKITFTPPVRDGMQIGLYVRKKLLFRIGTESVRMKKVM